MRNVPVSVGWICMAVVLAATGACSGHMPPRSEGSAREPFDAMVDEVMERYRLPGIAVGVVQNGEVIYTRTAGELIAGSRRRIDADTLFKIASNTKAMTTAVMARLVDAGKLRWDDPVIRHLPQFRMSDPWITRELQVRDLVIHNSGLRSGAGDLMLWPEPNQFTRADVIAGLAHLKPVHSFRSHYDYDNLLYIVAGEVAAAAAGVSYETLVRNELFAPLNLRRCQVGEFRRDDVGNVAQPHMRRGESNVPIRLDEEIVPAITMAAAGGVRCSLNDMLTWVRMWLTPRSQLGSTPWLSIAQREALWRAHTPMPLSQRQRDWDNSLFNAYGYGWRLSDVDGSLRVAHTGTLAGMYSAVTLLPEKNVGFVLMINGEGAEARTVLNQVLVKHFTAPNDARTMADYAAYLARERAAQPQESKAPDVSTRTPATAAALSDRLGVYRDPWFGEASLCAQGDGVRFSAMKSPKLTGDVMHAADRLLIDWVDEGIDAEAWLDVSTDAAPMTLKLAKVDPEADFSYDYEDLFFTRVRSCDDSAGDNDRGMGDSQRRGGYAMSKARHSDHPLSPDHYPLLQSIDQLMRGYAGDAPGASVLVIRNGEPVVRKSYGRANLEERRSATPETNYRLASVSKQFTAAAILLLAEEERLRLDDLARKWLPTLPAAAELITIRQLLTHTSGLIDYEDVIPASMTAQLRDADVLKILESQNRTYFAPGTSYRYSNSGYALLALIVERVSGKSFATFLRERIFAPLGMTNTVAYEDGVSIVANRAFGYSESNDGWTRTDQSQTSAVLGDGGVYSSIDDLAKWDAALYDERLLRRESLQLAFTPATPTDDPAIEYGFGWRITGETLWHSGESTGFRNVIVRYPQQRLTVVILTNRNEPEPYRLALAIGKLFQK